MRRVGVYRCTPVSAAVAEEEPETYAGEAGFMRALTRTTAIVYRTVVFGSLPRWGWTQ